MRKLERLGRLPLLIVDEVGYIPFDPEAAALFFALISSRYERRSRHGRKLRRPRERGRHGTARHGQHRSGPIRRGRAVHLHSDFQCGVKKIGSGILAANAQGPVLRRRHDGQEHRRPGFASGLQLPVRLHRRQGIHGKLRGRTPGGSTIQARNNSRRDWRSRSTTD